PSGYPAHPRSLGEHLRKRRLDLGLFQNQVANQLGVDEMTVVYREKARIKPSVRQLPKLVTFLGYVPFECPTDPLGRLRYYKRVQGLSCEALAQELEMDESMVTGWLAGKHRPSARSLERLDAFLRTKALPAPPHSPL
ncbi:helix-turn-helix transcriptional regulator, partial [Candidatus Methylomirabilis sp.]|uniref:helix-turn-helix domain-containing protein n=1 Tax=Candidatus Methylomirabilis sp. TaxID=2032687 RepID=UPI00307640B8